MDNYMFACSRVAKPYCICILRKNKINVHEKAPKQAFRMPALPHYHIDCPYAHMYTNILCRYGNPCQVERPWCTTWSCIMPFDHLDYVVPYCHETYTQIKGHTPRGHRIFIAVPSFSRTTFQDHFECGPLFGLSNALGSSSWGFLPGHLFSRPKNEETVRFYD